MIKLDSIKHYIVFSLQRSAKKKNKLIKITLILITYKINLTKKPKNLKLKKKERPI